MITDIEREQLDRIRESEQDFYAEILFLAFYRDKITEGQRDDIKRQTASDVADRILGVYADINERTVT